MQAISIDVLSSLFDEMNRLLIFIIDDRAYDVEESLKEVLATKIDRF